MSKLEGPWTEYDEIRFLSWVEKTKDVPLPKESLEAAAEAKRIESAWDNSDDKPHRDLDFATNITH